MVLRRQAERTASQIIWLGYFVAAVAGFSLSWWIRFRSGIFPLKQFQPFVDYQIPILIVAAFWGIVLAARGLHRPDLFIVWWREVSRITWAGILAMILPMALAFTYRGYFYSRLVLFLGTAISIAFCFIFKETSKAIIKRLVLKRIGVARKLLVGCGEFASKVVKEMKTDQLAAAGLEGMVSLHGERCIAELPYLGDLSSIKNLLIERGFDEVIFASPQLDEETILKIIYECRKEQVQFELVPPFWHFLRGKIAIENIGDVRTLAFTDLALKGWQRIVKRIMDILVSGMLILLLLPFFIVISILIKLTSSGAVLFKQERIGRNGRKFQMLKFRSMYMDAEQRLADLLALNEAKGPLFKIKKDPRITPIGRFMRRFSIDEFPQLFNVLKGEMSLVGPRPPLEREVVQYEEYQLRRTDVTPGMTGLWQISGRADLPFDKMVELDIFYIEHWSIWLDLKILLKTLPVVISGKGAY